MGHRLQQFLLPFGRIIDLGEFLLQVIPADDAILDEPFNRGKGAKDQLHPVPGELPPSAQKPPECHAPQSLPIRTRQFGR